MDRTPANRGDLLYAFVIVRPDRVSGRMIVRTLRIEGNHRYSWDKEPAVVVREPNAAVHLTLQNDQLMSERRILCFKPALRLKWRGQGGQYET